LNILNINFPLLPTEFLLPLIITTQPTYLHNVISIQPTRSTRYSSVVTLLDHQPSPHRKLQIVHLRMHHLVFGINFTYSFRHLHQFRHDSLPRDVKSYLSSSPLSASITPLFFHSRFKSSLFQNSSHHNRPTLYPRKKPQPCAFRDKIAKSQPI